MLAIRIKQVDRLDHTRFEILKQRHQCSRFYIKPDMKVRKLHHASA